MRIDILQVDHFAGINAPLDVIDGGQVAAATEQSLRIDNTGDR